MQIDQHNSSLDMQGLLLTMFFISPYLITALAFKIRTDITTNLQKTEPIILIFIIVTYSLTHNAGHSYSGNSGSGYEWVPAYIAAILGVVISLVLLLWGTFCRYKHNKALQPTSENGAAEIER